MQAGPTRPVVFGETVLYRYDGILAGPGLIQLHHVGGVQTGTFALENVETIGLLVQLSGSHVQGYMNVLAGGVARLLHGLQNHLQGVTVGGQTGGEPALIAHVGVVAVVAQKGLQRLVDLGSCAQCIRKAFNPHRHHHELLDVGRVGGVFAAVQDIEHGHWKRNWGAVRQVVP